MCYTGKCLCENYMGDCALSSDEIKFLKENFNITCFAPTCPEDEDNPIFSKAEKALNDYRIAKEVIRKLMG